MAALTAAAALEPGVVLNEHYTFQEYINRRGSYLGNHPSFKFTFIRLFPIARRDAESIFYSENEKLPVQEVRRREIRNDIVPLLPLPTTGNTQTIDDFATCRPANWSPPSDLIQSSPMSTRNMRLASETSSPDAMVYQNHSRSTDNYFDNLNSESSDIASDADNSSSNSSTLPTEFPRALADSLSQQEQLQSQKSALSLARRRTKASSSVKGMNGAFSQRANTTKRVQANAQARQSSFSNKASSSPSSGLHSSSNMSKQSTQPTSPSANTSSGHVTPSRVKAKSSTSELQGTLQNVTATMGTGPAALSAASSQARRSTVPTGSARLSRNLIVPDGVSSLKSRAMSSPVKTMRGKKRARSATPEAAAEVADNEPAEDSLEDIQPAQKKVKLHLTKANPKPEKTRKATSSRTKISHIESVIRGTALPRNQAEAHSAAKTRHSRHLARHRAKYPKSDSKLVPDFMPEFFEVKNFPANNKKDEVRCLCGETENEGPVMIACDKCSVWQHQACAGEALPPDPEDDDYLCQVCDPWVHRVEVARMRRKKPL